MGNLESLEYFYLCWQINTSKTVPSTIGTIVEVFIFTRGKVLKYYYASIQDSYTHLGGIIVRVQNESRVDDFARQREDVKWSVDEVIPTPGYVQTA